MFFAMHCIVCNIIDFSKIGFFKWIKELQAVEKHDIYIRTKFDCVTNFFVRKKTWKLNERCWSDKTLLFCIFILHFPATRARSRFIIYRLIRTQWCNKKRGKFLTIRCVVFERAYPQYVRFLTKMYNSSHAMCTTSFYTLDGTNTHFNILNQIKRIQRSVNTINYVNV